jgi:hypothetical protein
MIDEVRIPFPRNRAELNAIYDRLDREGLAAAGMAAGRLAEGDVDADHAKGIEAAKN